MSGDGNNLRRVEWTEIFPWLMIFRVFRLSTRAPILFLATVAILLTPLGWRAADKFIASEDGSDMANRAGVAANHTWPSQEMAALAHEDSGILPSSWAEFTAPMQQPFRQVILPFQNLFSRDTELKSYVYFLTGSIWTLLVWAFFGGVITRVAVVRLGRDERESMGNAIRFAAKRFSSYFGCPLFSLFGVVVFSVFASIVGLVLRLDTGVLLASLIWVLVLLGGLLVTVLLLGLLFGWPLMWGAISTEEMGDVFEAAQRCYSYTFGRPLHYLFYAAIALLLGSAGFLLVQYLAAAVIELSYWGVSWGASESRLRDIVTSSDGVVIAGNAVIQMLNGLVLTVASAFRYSFFWCAAAAIYLLLRRDIDRTEFDDVYMIDEQQRYGVLPVATDEDSNQ